MVAVTAYVLSVSTLLAALPSDGAAQTCWGCVTIFSEEGEYGVGCATAEGGDAQCDVQCGGGACTCHTEGPCGGGGLLGSLACEATLVQGLLSSWASCIVAGIERAAEAEAYEALGPTTAVIDRGPVSPPIPAPDAPPVLLKATAMMAPMSMRDLVRMWQNARGT